MRSWRNRAGRAGLVAVALALGALLLVPVPAQAVVVVLDFEGIGDQAFVQNFYNGGTDSAGNSGTNYGISFGSASRGIIDLDAGGSGNFANEPSPSTILFFLSGSAILNIAAGFDTGFSFFYTSVSFAGSVDVYDGLDGTGTLLASLALVANGSGCGGDPNGTFNCWTPVGVPFAGIAKSINFGGVANQIGFDDVTFGSQDPGPRVPFPATLLLVGAGLSLFALRYRRK
jgi:hypothetical protein